MLGTEGSRIGFLESLCSQAASLNGPVSLPPPHPPSFCVHKMVIFGSFESFAVDEVKICKIPTPNPRS